MAAPAAAAWLGALPSVNAVLNATSAVCLALGLWAIRRGRVLWHLRLMLSALLSSACFLVGYLTRMWLTGTHRFPGTGPIKAFYLGLLVTHMILAVVLLPMVLRTLQLALTGRFGQHRYMARRTWPVWMYVSVTGVVVYWMLYHLAPQMAA